MVPFLVTSSHGFLVLLVDLFLFSCSILLLTLVLTEVTSLLMHFFAKRIFFFVVLHLDVSNFIFVRGLLFVELLAVVILELR